MVYLGGESHPDTGYHSGYGLQKTPEATSRLHRPGFQSAGHNHDDVVTFDERDTVHCGKMSLEIDSADVIRLMLQFLKEHNLSDTMQTLQKESGVTLNTVDNIDSFGNDIRNGKWDSVLSQTAALKLPADKLVRHMRCLHLCNRWLI